MSNYSTFDRESFQKLLASAFALQQSQIDRQSLSAIVELERLITRGELDLDGALPLIADRARNVANATGIAIGLLKGDQLVYRAGSGSAAAYIGKRVLATLTVSTDRKVSGELLRVENAQTDPRIEAGVCRQFGAKSLLILLIYQDRAVAGLLHVLFSEPHVFQDREVCIYRLMAGLIGEAMCHAAQLERGQSLTAELPDNPLAIEQITPETERVLIDGGSMEGPSNQPVISPACGAATAVTGELPVVEQPVVPAIMIMERAKRLPWHKSRWNVALAAVAAVLVIACWIGYSVRRPNSAAGSSAQQKSIAIQQQAPSLPAKALPAKTTSKLQTTPVPVEQTRSDSTTRRRVLAGENQVEYIGEDVTVRYFTTKPAPHRARSGENEVADIGEDVTMRYFTPKPAVVPPTQPARSAAQPVGRLGSGQR
jgi:hypothetical protein